MKTYIDFEISRAAAILGGVSEYGAQRVFFDAGNLTNRQRLVATLLGYEIVTEGFPIWDNGVTSGCYAPAVPADIADPAVLGEYLISIDAAISAVTINKINGRMRALTTQLTLISDKLMAADATLTRLHADEAIILADIARAQYELAEVTR